MEEVLNLEDYKSNIKEICNKLELSINLCLDSMKYFEKLFNSKTHSYSSDVFNI